MGLLKEMPMNNDAKKRNIASIEKNTRFEIPPYQRLYEWEKEQIEALLEDVKKAQEERKKIYFIGNVVVSEENGKYILIDGQQRLTTLFLIGIYLASKKREISNNPWLGFVKTKDNKLRISMPLRENEERWLLDFIDKKDKDFEKLSKKNPNIQYKITRGLEVIAEWFKKNKLNLGDFSSFLYGTTNEDGNQEGVCFALVKLAENTDLNQFFVRMNNRGKQLEKHEILKARLLNVIKEEKDWKAYAKIWDLCSDMDKYIFQSASDRNFLRDLKGESDNQSEKTLCAILQDIKEGDKGNNGSNSKDDDDLEKVKSIIDFPTFLLHIAKLIKKDISINKDKLLEIIVESKNTTKKQEATLLLDSEGKVKIFIRAMLRYRILFDYFVIKRIVDENLSESGEYSIRRLNSSKKNNTYYSIGGSVMNNLVMIQNYLRVARAGDRQNYHHWLTPFLKEASKVQKIDNCLIFNNEVLEWLIKKDDKQEYPETELVPFLENLDTDLAIAQIENQNNENTLLDTTKKWLQPNPNKEKIKEVDFSFLNKGTGTPHYWFYRLEYYLWRDRESRKNIEMKIDGNTFSFEIIANNYRFRGLNSIEHIQPQSKKNEWEQWGENKKCGIDDFGNLALISQSFNSSLSNQDMEKKWIDIKNNKDVESLKMCLAYASVGGKYEDWNPDKAKEHQNKMLEILETSFKQK